MDNQIDIQSVESLPSYVSDSYNIKGHDAEIERLGQKAAARLAEVNKITDNQQWEQDKALDFNSYHLTPPNKPLPYAGYPNLACPLPRIGVDTFHANTMYTFMGQTGKFTVLPDLLSRSHIDKAERAAKYLTYVLNHEADFYTALDRADLDVQTYGTGFLEPIYVKEQAWETRLVTKEESVPVFDELTGDMTKKTVKRTKKERVKKTIFDGIKVKRVPPECIKVSPFFEDLEDAVSQDYVFKVKNYKFRQIEQLSKGGDEDIPAFFKASAVRKLKDFCSAQITTELDRAKQAYDGFAVDSMLEQKDILLAEAHCWEDLNGDGLAEKVTLVIEAMSGIVLRATWSECRITKLVARPVNGRFWGESVRKAIQSLCIEWEAIHNARVAKGQWSNLPFFFYRAGGRFNPQTITLMPGKGYPLDDPQSVNFPQFPSPDMSYFNEEQIIDRTVERVLGLNEGLQGVVSKGDTTATETINAQQRAGIRLSTPMGRLAVGLNKLMGHIWELNKQCAPEIKEYKVAGVGNGEPVFEKITNQDYDVMVNFKLSMATLFDVQMLRDTALLNYRTFISNPLVMQHPAAFYELTKQTMKAVGLEINIPKPEQAKTKSPFVEHDMIMAGKLVEPVIGEDLDEHLAAHEALIKSDEFKAWSEEAQMALILHRDKTMAQKSLLESANLNQSGIFPGAGPMGAEGTPAMTATRNPSQTFNNLKVGESGKSQKQNVQNSQANY